MIVIDERALLKLGLFKQPKRGVTTNRIGPIVNKKNKHDVK